MYMSENERQIEREEGMKRGEKHSDLILGISRCKLRNTNSCIGIIIDLKKYLIILRMKPRVIMTN